MPHRQRLLVLLLVVLAFNFMDRWAIGLVLQDIKASLSLSDTQLGLLTGIAFALFYSVMGIPIARWADFGNRPRILALTLSLSAVAIALCGAVSTFVQLLLVRILVGVGEAGCVPTAHSLIGDSFDRTERPRAMGILMMGGPVSVLLGYCVAGWLSELYGWRTMFALLAIPGFVLAPLALLLIREPRANHVISSSEIGTVAFEGESPGVVQAISALWQIRAFRDIALCLSVIAFFGYGIAQWQPSFFIRTYGIGTGELGNWFSLIYGAGGLVGTYLGGFIASRYAANNERLQLRTAGILYALFGVISALTYLSSHMHVAFALLALSAVGGTVITAPLFSIVQSLVHPKMRALAVATIYLFSNLIGMGLGPLLAGALSDFFRRWAGEQSLRFALISLCPGYLWGAWHLLRASRFVKRELQASAAT